MERSSSSAWPRRTGQAELEADADDVRDFLARTEQVLPRGQEHTVIDLDAELAQLLAES